MTQTIEALVVETSFAQQSLWLLDQADPGQPTYNVLAAVRLRGELDVPALHRALNTVIARHEALRTTFTFDGFEPLQVIRPELTVALPVHEVAADRVEALIEAEIARPFDLATGPLLRMQLLRVDPTEHIAVLVMHHIVTDGWSSAILFRELSSAYEAYADGEEDPELPRLPIQYADYAVWQRESMTGERLAELYDYWSDQLTGVTPLLLPTDRARPAQATSVGDTLAFDLPAGLVTRLDRLGREQSATPAMLYLAAFAVLLSRYTGRDELTVATPVAGRTRPELGGLIGYFVNTLVLRADLAGDPTFLEMLGRIRDTSLGAYANAEVPYEKLVEQLRPDRYHGNGGPLAQVMFSIQNIPSDPWRAGGLTFEAMHVATRTAKFDLSLELTPIGGGHRAVLEYSTELFLPDTVARFGELYRTLLESIAADPRRTISSLPLLTPPERAALLPERAPVSVDCVHRLFARQAEATPDATAVVCGDRRVTYAELDRHADRLAWHLRGCGVAPGDIVAVLLPRSVDLIATLLAVLKAGAAYLPLDPAYPAERLDFMLADSGARFTVTETVLAGVDTTATVSTMDGGAVDDLAYVIYTSGSTGTPKGALNTHRGLATFALTFAAELGLTPADRALQLAPIGFDVLAEEVYPYLLTGGSVALPDGAPPVPAQELWALAAATGATTLSTTPSRLVTWTAADRAGIPATLHRIIFGSEGAPTLAALAPWRDWPGQLWQVYGVTEAACSSVLGPVDFDGDPQLPVPMGRPLPGIACHVLDRWLEPVPPGVAGELYLGGPTVCDGYLGRADLSAQRFLPDPFGGPGDRLYRTGDVVRRTPDGTLSFVGRTDDQVKIRGHRVEPGEVEAVLSGAPGVAAVAVTARPDGHGQLRLIAYAVPGPGIRLVVSALHGFATEHMPSWMVPADYVLLDTLPLTPNGKVDRAALAEPDRAVAVTEYVAPATPIERELAAIWSEVLDRPKLGARDSFFALGGNSLLAVQMLAQVRERLGVELGMRVLFTAEPTIAELGAQVAQAQTDGAAVDLAHIAVGPLATPNAAGEREYPASTIETLMWHLHHEYPGESTFITLGALRMIGDLDLALLERALNAMLVRHDVLRAVYRCDGGEVIRVERPHTPMSIPVREVTADDVDDAGAAVIDEPFDLTTGPMVRLKLLHEPAVAGEPDRHIAVLVLHHIVSDGRSMELFFTELATLYLAYAAGIAEPLPPLRLRYADIAAWQRARLTAPVREEQARYWTDRLAGHELLRLPTDVPRAPVPTSAGLTYGIRISDELTHELRAMAAAHQATLFMITLAAIYPLLASYGDQRDVLVATPASWRDRPEIDELMGAFINYVLLRADLRDNPTFADLVDMVRDLTAADLANQELPLSDVCAVAGYGPTEGRHELLRTLFTEEANPSVPLTDAGQLRGELMDPPWHHALRDFTVRVTAAEDGTYVIFTYRTDAFSAARIADIAEDYRDVLTRVVAEPHRRAFEPDGPFGVPLRVAAVTTDHQGGTT